MGEILMEFLFWVCFYLLITAIIFFLLDPLLGIGFFILMCFGLEI